MRAMPSHWDLGAVSVYLLEKLDSSFKPQYLEKSAYSWLWAYDYPSLFNRLLKGLLSPTGFSRTEIKKSVNFFQTFTLFAISFRKNNKPNKHMVPLITATYSLNKIEQLIA